MLAEATKYTPVESARQAARPAPMPPAQRAAVRNDLTHMFGLHTGQSRELSLTEWIAHEARSGGRVHLVFERRRQQINTIVRRAAVNHWHEQQATQHLPRAKRKSDQEVREIFSVPPELYFQWQRVDPDFWSDVANLKSLRRDNDDLRQLIHT